MDDATVRFLLERNLVARAQGDDGDYSETPSASVSPSPLQCLTSVGLKFAVLGAVLTSLDLQISVNSQAVARMVFLPLQESQQCVCVVSARPRIVLLSFPHSCSSKRTNLLPTGTLSAGVDAVSSVVSSWMPSNSVRISTPGKAHTLSELHAVADSLAVECALAFGRS